MDWKTEFTPKARRDVDLTLDHLFEANFRTMKDADRASVAAADRVRKIPGACEAIAAAPYQGTRHPDWPGAIRHVTKGRAIIYFQLLEDRHLVRILAVFYGGQDHVRRMLLRLAKGGN